MKRGPYCIICADIRTNHPSGICSRCRRSYERTNTREDNSGDIIPQKSRRIKAALERESLTLETMKLRKEGKTFDEISEILNKPKTSLFDNFCVAMASYLAPQDDQIYEKWVEDHKARKTIE